MKAAPLGMFSKCLYSMKLRCRFFHLPFDATLTFELSTRLRRKVGCCRWFAPMEQVVVLLWFLPLERASNLVQFNSYTINKDP